MMFGGAAVVTAGNSAGSERNQKKRLRKLMVGPLINDSDSSRVAAIHSIATCQEQCSIISDPMARCCLFASGGRDSNLVSAQDAQARPESTQIPFAGSLSSTVDVPALQQADQHILD